MNTSAEINTWQVLRRFLALSAGYWNGPFRMRARMQVAALILLSVLQVVLAVRLNLWNADLFDALERRSMARFASQVGVLVLLVAGIMLINAAHLHIKRRLQFGWRQWLTQQVMENWMAEARQYQVALLPGDHANPDGRIADDIRISTELAIELAHSGFYCLLLFCSFLGILWSLSGVIVIDFGAISFDLPGHMVILALLYAGGGSLLAFLVGGRLVAAANERQTAEQDFRFGLVQARENTEAIALARSEAGERRRLGGLFTIIHDSWNEQTTGLRQLMMFSSAYGVLASVFPILVASPRYLAGSITLGALMQTAQAFQQMTAALSWPVDNFPRLAEWQASVERVLGLHAALENLRRSISEGGQCGIRVVATAGPALNIRDLTITSPGGVVLASGISSTIPPGERVLISGDDQAGQLLFKSVAGIWLWGKGDIELPDNASLLFMPRQPYLPRDTLQALLSYPDPADQIAPAAAKDLLRKVGLERLEDQLDVVADWSARLKLADQQRIGCARLLLRRPGWVFMAEATAALEPPDETRIFQLILSELPQATILTLDHRPHLEPFHTRKLELICRADHAVVVHETSGYPPPAPEQRPARLRRWMESIKQGLSAGD